MRRVFAVAVRTWRHAIVRFPTFITCGFVCPEGHVASRRLDTNGFDRAMNSGACTLERAVARSKPMRSDTSRSARQKVRGDAPRRLRESTRDRASGIDVPAAHADFLAVPLCQRPPPRPRPHLRSALPPPDPP